MSQRGRSAARQPPERHGGIRESAEIVGTADAAARMPRGPTGAVQGARRQPGATSARSRRVGMGRLVMMEARPLTSWASISELRHGAWTCGYDVYSRRRASRRRCARAMLLCMLQWRCGEAVVSHLPCSVSFHGWAPPAAAAAQRLPTPVQQRKCACNGSARQRRGRTCHAVRADARHRLHCQPRSRAPRHLCVIAPNDGARDVAPGASRGLAPSIGKEDVGLPSASPVHIWFPLSSQAVRHSHATAWNEGGVANRTLCRIQAVRAYQTSDRRK